MNEQEATAQIGWEAGVFRAVFPHLSSIRFS